jgi:adenylate cyclase
MIREVERSLVDSLHTAVAVARHDTLELIFENSRFQQWFPPGGCIVGDDEGRADGLLPDPNQATGPPGERVPGDASGLRAGNTLTSRLPHLDSARLADRISRGRPYRLEAEASSGPRPIPIALEFRSAEIDARPVVLVEGTSIVRQKEAEYMLDSYSRMMERQARDLEQEKVRAEKLLLNIMPRSVYDELLDSGTTTPRSYSSASVLMLDFVGFTEMAISRDPSALIAELNDIFSSFDRIVEHFRCERIKTIGDAYMAVAGVPEPDPDHARNLAHAALRMRRFLEKRNRASHHRWLCRIGMGTGPVIGSIVGVQKYVYDIFGPAVNLAARLEQQCEPMQILVGPETADRIRDDFVVRPMGELEIKGFGCREIFHVEDEARSGR